MNLINCPNCQNQINQNNKMILFQTNSLTTSNTISIVWTKKQ